MERARVVFPEPAAPCNHKIRCEEAFNSQSAISSRMPTHVPSRHAGRPVTLTWSGCSWLVRSDASVRKVNKRRGEQLTQHVDLVRDSHDDEAVMNIDPLVDGYPERIKGLYECGCLLLASATYRVS